MNQHTLKAFDREIGRVNRQMVLMGSFCEMQLRNARDAFKQGDHDLAADVISSDQELNRLKLKIEADVLSIIARRQPVALDLRMLVSLLKIACELERIGDYAANISKRVITLPAAYDGKVAGAMVDMMDSCLAMLSSAVGVIMDMKTDDAIGIWHRDHDVDKKFVGVMTALKQGVNEDSCAIENYPDMLFIARFCERIGDHITNICEDIYYACEGKAFLSEQKSGSDTGEGNAI